MVCRAESWTAKLINCPVLLILPMKFYGHTLQNAFIENTEPHELHEVTLMATSDELRKIAQFLLSEANTMEKQGKDYCHRHLSDQETAFKDSPHLIVFNSEHKK